MTVGTAGHAAPVYSYQSPSGSDNFSGYSLGAGLRGRFTTGSSDIYSGSSQWYSPMTVMYFGNHYGVDSFDGYGKGPIVDLSDTTLWVQPGSMISSVYNLAAPKMTNFTSETLRTSSSLWVGGYTLKKYSSSFSP